MAPGGPFLFGQFSIADCMYAPVVSRFLTYGVAMTDDVKAYAERVMALPAMQEWRAGAEQEIAEGLPDQWLIDMPRKRAVSCHPRESGDPEACGQENGTAGGRRFVERGRCSV
jgi:hypothetical protein